MLSERLRPESMTHMNRRSLTAIATQPHRPIEFTQRSLFADLPQRETEFVLSNLDIVTVRSHQVIYRTSDPLTHIYFPHDAVLTSLLSTPDGKSVQVATFGRFEALGIEAVFGATKAETVSIAVVPGMCARMSIATIKESSRSNGQFLQRLFWCARQFMTQLSQTSVCNRLHGLRQRFCRWLLTVNERNDCRRLDITHEQLAAILGAARSEVTNLTLSMRQDEIIEYRRASIGILNLARVADNACDCYQRVRDPRLPQPSRRNVRAIHSLNGPLVLQQSECCWSGS